jgi:hypothetical protein
MLADIGNGGKRKPVPPDTTASTHPPAIPQGIPGNIDAEQRPGAPFTGSDECTGSFRRESSRRNDQPDVALLVDFGYGIHRNR